MASASSLPAAGFGELATPGMNWHLPVSEWATTQRPMMVEPYLRWCVRTRYALWEMSDPAPVLDGFRLLSGLATDGGSDV